MTLPDLSLIETRVLGVLVEKQHTVPDTYPLTLLALTAGCNQKTSRDPILSASEPEVQAAIDRLKMLSLVVESSGGRVMRYAQNVGRVLDDPDAGGRAPCGADAARTANRRASCGSTAIASIGSRTRPQSKRFCRSSRRARRARSSCSFPASRAHAKRAGRTSCRARLRRAPRRIRSRTNPRRDVGRIPRSPRCGPMSRICKRSSPR